MKIYEGKTKKYRIKERKYSNGKTEYYLQWKYYAWYGIFWEGAYGHFNSFSTLNDIEDKIYSFIELDKNVYDRKIYVEKLL